MFHSLIRFRCYFILFVTKTVTVVTSEVSHKENLYLLEAEAPEPEPAEA